MSKDYYSVLGVSKSATKDEIKKAFRKKAHEYHPDKNTGNEKKFKEANEAYQTLSNDEKRKQYDQFGSTFEQASSQGGAGFGGAGFNWQDFRGSNNGYRTNVNFGGIEFDLGDIMGDFFGGNSSSSSRRGEKRGSDLQYHMEISLKESAYGCEKVVNIEKLNKCENCGGKGYDSNAKIIECPECKGQGQIKSIKRTILGAFESRTICPTCEGSGKKPDKFCTKCHGKGRVRGSSQLKIKIPAGINTGESIKLGNQGEAGEKGSANGDLYITFKIKPSNQFRRSGYDILSTHEINIVQAVLGDKIEVEVLDGFVRLKIPPGTEHGKIFKLSGKGTYKLHGRGRGDHLVEIKIVIPKNLSRKAKKIMEDLKDEIS